MSTKALTMAGAFALAALLLAACGGQDIEVDEHVRGKASDNGETGSSIHCDFEEFVYHVVVRERSSGATAQKCRNKISDVGCYIHNVHKLVTQLVGDCAAGDDEHWCGIETDYGKDGVYSKDAGYYTIVSRVCEKCGECAASLTGVHRQGH